jgi:hypothetical protein
MPETTASAVEGTARVRYYEGPTSEGGSFRMRVVVADGVPSLALLLVSGPYGCEDGTVGEIDDGVGWVPTGPVIQGGRLQLSETWSGVAFDVAGRLGSRGGSGTLTFLWPALTNDRQAAQLCTVGEAAWTVERTSEADFERTIERTPEDVDLEPVLAARATAGRTVVGLGAIEGVQTAATTFGGIRTYHGRTSQDRRMSARTSRVDTGIAVSFLSLGLVLACDDGTESEVGIRPLTYFDTTQVMPPGRLDLDLAPGSALSQGFALGVHGDLDAHAGSGTLTMISSSLTEDRRPQLCRSEAQTWRLWRTDAGS